MNLFRSKSFRSLFRRKDDPSYAAVPWKGSLFCRKDDPSSAAAPPAAPRSADAPLPSYWNKFLASRRTAATPSPAPSALPPAAPASAPAEAIRRRLAARRAADPPSPSPAAPPPAGPYATQNQCEGGGVLRDLGIDPGPLRNLETTAAGVKALRASAQWYKTRLAGAGPEERARLQADALKVLKTPEPEPDAPAESERPANQLQCEAATAIRYAGFEPGDVNAIQATPEGVKALYGSARLYRNLMARARPDEKRRLEDDVIATLAGKNGTASDIVRKHSPKGTLILHEKDHTN